MTVDRSWRDRAACRDVVTAEFDPFFAGTPEGTQAAIAICGTCPVPAACLTFAVRTGQQYGVWGGQPEQALRRLVALTRRGQVPATHHNASKTHCKRGHPFDLANTYYAPDGQRRCRTCLRDAQPIRAPRYLGGGGSDAA
jgi:WhiB family transcriptional regulator, redox-sensing transcriptional regulator